MSGAETEIPPAEEAFWAALRSGTLVIQRCAACGYLRWPPGPVCPECLSAESTWAEVPARGRLVSFAVYHRYFGPSPAIETPYVVGLVELDDGPRLYGRIDDGPEPLRVDGEVVGVFPAPDGDPGRMLRWRMV